MTSPRTPQFAQQFITANYTTLAALAWSGYLKHGRGAVVVESGSEDVSKCRYIPMEKVWGQLAHFKILHAYEPRDSICVFVGRDMIHVKSQEPAKQPPECFKVVNSRTDEFVVRHNKGFGDCARQ